MIIRPTELTNPVIQNLVPVMTTDGVLHGMLQITPTEFKNSEEDLELGNNVRVHVKAYSFDNKRTLMCAMFPVSLSTGRDSWNGLPNFLDPSKFGIFSYWATPVLSANYQRSTIGLADIFVTSSHDPKKPTINTQSSNPSFSPKEVIKATINVSEKRFESPFSFIEICWTDILKKKFGEIPPCRVFKVDSCIAPQSFKTVFYSKSTTDSTPRIMQIMRIGSSPISSFSQFVLSVLDTSESVFYQIILTLNLK